RQVERPQSKPAVVAADGLDVAEAVGAVSHVLVFMPDDGPNLPAGQAVAVALADERIEIIIRHDVRFARPAIQREHDEENVIAEQVILHVPVERADGGVILVGNRRALLKIEREQSETAGLILLRVRASGKGENLDELPAPFGSVTAIRHDRISEIKFVPLSAGIGQVGHQGWDRPEFFGVALLKIKKRPQRFGAVSGLEGQVEMVVKKSEVRPIGSGRPGRPKDSQYCAAKNKAPDMSSGIQHESARFCMRTEIQEVAQHVKRVGSYR